MTALRRRSWWCTFGVHWSTYRDGAFFRSAERCNRCNVSIDPERGRELARERRLWSSVPAGLSFEDKLGWVASRLYPPPDPAPER